MALILVVDDEAAILKVLKTVLNLRHHDVIVASNGNDALDLLRENRVELMLTDIMMRPMDGFELLKKAKQLYPSLPVVFMTGYDTIANSISGLQLGVFDCIKKPVRMEELTEVVKNALKTIRSSTGENDAVLPAPVLFRFGTIIAESLEMQRVCRDIEKAAATSASILLCGEAGNGKSLIARAIHDYGVRKNSNFIEINCAVAPEVAMERLILGDAAEPAQLRADSTSVETLQSTESGGTVLLNGILKLPPELLKKLALHLLKSADNKSNAGATSRPGLIMSADAPLESMLLMGGFATLLTQICGLTIAVKPLRERNSDIRPLLSHFFYQKIGDWKKLPVLAPDAFSLLMRYTWPGNHSELAELVNNLFPKVTEGRITKDMLPAKIVEFRPPDLRGESLKTLLNAQLPTKAG